MVVKLIVMERLFQSIKINGFKLQLSTIVIKLLSIVVFKANVKQKIDMEIVITTTIRFIKKVTKSNIGENNLIENNKNNRRNNDK